MIFLFDFVFVIKISIIYDYVIQGKNFLVCDLRRI